MLIRLPRVMLSGSTECARYMLMSDLHIGSAHMDRELLRADLQWAKDNNAHVFIAGDVFDLILPKDHKRYTPEVYCKELRDGGSNIINTSLKLGVSLLGPYAGCIDMIGCGNHETSVQKYHATDIVAMLIEQLSTKGKHQIRHGGYTGGISIPITPKVACKGRENTFNNTRTLNIYYHHGSGGAAPVSKGMIDFHRMATFVDRAHVLWCGHKHNRFVDHAKIKSFGSTTENFFYYDQFRIMTGSYATDGEGSQIDKDGCYVQSWEREKHFAPQGRGGIKLAANLSKEDNADNGNGRRRVTRLQLSVQL